MTQSPPTGDLVARASDAFSPVSLMPGEVHCPTCKGSGLWATGMDDILCHVCKGSGVMPETSARAALQVEESKG